MSDTPRFERRSVVLAVSLKMYFDPERTVRWSEQVAQIARNHPAVTEGRVELVVLPSFPSLSAVVDAVSMSAVEVGAQDLHYEDRGPFTGEVSGADLRQLGVRYVEVGHSERRRFFGEDDAVVRRKVDAAWRNDLVPILCVGERDRASAENAAQECIRQLDAALPRVAGPVTGGVTGVSPLIVAYEPEWSIGAEHPADTGHIVAVLAALRAHLANTHGLPSPAIIYGGSAGEGLLRELGEAADGLFLGRFVHEPMALKAILDESAIAR